LVDQIHSDPDLIIHDDGIETAFDDIRTAGCGAYQQDRRVPVLWPDTFREEVIMSKEHEIDVFFHNLWGAEVKDITLKFSTSKAGSAEQSHTKKSLAAGEKWGPLRRKYETGPGSGEFDFWFIEFTSAGRPSGVYKGRTEFACVIDTDVTPEGKIDVWISGKDRAFYTGYPDSTGGRPGVSGYSGFPKDGPGGDYTCSSKLETQQPEQVLSAGC
jgi:hypothetical protein